MSILEDLTETIYRGQEEKAVDLTKQLFSKKIDPDLIKQATSSGIIKAGESWTCAEFSSAEILMAIDAFKEAKQVITLSGFDYKRDTLGKVIIATIAGNVHVLGKELVGALLDASGFEVIDIGVNVPRNIIKDKIRELKPDILALGCYTLSGQHELKTLLSEIISSGLKTNLKVIIGGHSTSQALANQLGADAWASSVLDTVERAKLLIDKTEGIE
jgi:methanogenic corrinoid protein MtbC1